MDSTIIIENLKQWASCDIADGLSKLKHPRGGFLQGLTMYSPNFQSGSTKIVGQVFTVKFVLNTDTEAPKMQGNYIDQVPKDSVLFISQPVPHIHAVFGGLMSLRSKVRGAVGVVIDGNLRDLQEHRDLEVFAKGVGTTACGEMSRPSETNVDIQFHSASYSTTITPGDYIIADLDGVICIPKDLAEPCLAAIPKIAAANVKCAEAIKNGMSVEEAFKRFR